MVAVRARAFLPASVFFRGPRNATDPSFSDRRMTELFAGASKAADAKFAQVVADAGPALIDAEWIHDNQHIEYKGLAETFEVLASSVVLPGRALLGDFARFSAAFTCDVCLSSSAVRQCAACQDLLCALCAVRCAFDHDPQRAQEGRATYQYAFRAPTCAFAMCVECDEAARTVGDDPHELLDSVNPSPQLFEQMCELCRDENTELRCPAHVVLEEKDDMHYCQVCDSQGCWMHRRDFCEACYEERCSRCTPGDYRICEECCRSFCPKCKDTARGSHFFCTSCRRYLCSSCMRRGGCDRATRNSASNCPESCGGRRRAC